MTTDAKEDPLREELRRLGLLRIAEVYPEDIQDLAKYVLSHRIWLGPHAASHGVTVDMVIDEVIEQVPVP